LSVVDTETISSQLIPLEVKIDVITAAGPLREDRASFGQLRQDPLDLLADLLDHLEVAAGDLDPDRSPNAGCLHVNSSLDRHGPGIRDPRDLERFIHPADQFLG
jgi:hypothetical protein